jgi:3-dehydroquinate dehydratase-2
MLLAHAKANKYQLDIFYTNIEGEAINRLYRAVDEGVQGLVMNPAGFNHAGYALRDCVRALPFPYVEVHMTNIEARGIKPVIAPVAVGGIYGFGVNSYVLGLDAMLKLLRK